MAVVLVMPVKLVVELPMVITMELATDAEINVSLMDLFTTLSFRGPVDGSRKHVCRD